LAPSTTGFVGPTNNPRRINDHVSSETDRGTAVVASLNELARRGLARRKPDLSDRRRNIVTLTKRGADVLERLDAVLDDVQNHVLAPLTIGERETFVRLLTKLT
jgi:DNA-binding MarR family transcriptional regulator